MRTNINSRPVQHFKIPHEGALYCRYNGDNGFGDVETLYAIDIVVADDNQHEGSGEYGQASNHSQESSRECDGGTSSLSHHELCYTRKDFEFAQRLFAILDTESVGLVERRVIQEFVTLRCPVFWRRDDDLKHIAAKAHSMTGDDDEGENDSPTFNEIWNSVVSCCNECASGSTGRSKRRLNQQSPQLIGVEGWMVFCRFIALAQYLEAKRRFSARHLQQTMRHRNSPRGSEVVVVDVPPPSPPASLSPLQLARHERNSNSPLPLPELDLDHSLLAAHDITITARGAGMLWKRQHGYVKISVFGPPNTSSFSTSLLNSSGSSNSSSNLEFAVTYVPSPSAFHNDPNLEEIVVRRSMADMKWLNDTFTSHKVLGGTLCGRILPPFPGMTSNSPAFQKDESVTTSIKSTGGAITKAAASSVGKVRDFAVSYLKNYVSASGSVAPAPDDDSPSNNSVQNTQHGSSAVTGRKAPSIKKPSKMISGRLYSDGFRNPNSPALRARQLERYLNYLLEHPALSTSFPLNTILKASQSGLEAAKESLDEISKARKELSDQTPQLDDGKVSIPFWPASSSGDSSNSPNLAWVRTAAQAAMALRVHGMLETTGMNSASARLQHASLPSFGMAARARSWDEDEHHLLGSVQEAVAGEGDEAQTANNFEEGVICVQSELDSAEVVGDNDTYDLLPLPVPAPERRILTLGSGISSSSALERETRFHYGTGSIQSTYGLARDDGHAFLGEIAVDENIDKLREVIGSVDNTLSRCMASMCGIVKAQRERQALHLKIVKGLDSWNGMRGKFISQRSLLKGVAGIEQSRDIYDEGDISMIEDISWQTALASSAVSAAEDVRSAVRVSRTATNAKAAASSAAFAAQSACDSKFSTIDEARAAQTRASIAHSHAIHAAVVEHEAHTVKRRATLALAHDVKCWNVHRKHELHRACIDYGRSQHEATRRAVDAWSSLRDGFIGTTILPSAHERRQKASLPVSHSESSPPSMLDSNEVSATIYNDVVQGTGGDGQVSIVAVEHNILSSSPPSPPAFVEKMMEAKESSDNLEADLVLTFATASPIPDELEAPAFLSAESNHNNFDDPQALPGVLVKTPMVSEHSESKTEENLSGSMQSLIDGLMNWGGGLDAEEEHFALPAGMAASIAFEEVCSVAIDSSLMT